MSGIIAPSIVNYEWTVKDSDNSFLNVSFPFRVKIESIWFTTQNYSNSAGLYGGVSGNIMDTTRELKLAAIKSKNTRKQWDSWDNPTEFTWAFSPLEYGADSYEANKPTLWLGNPDDASGNLGAFATGGYANTWILNQRSTASAPLEKNWYTNTSWSSGEHAAQTYEADVAIMNTDEFLQLFVYASNGDWTDYADDAVVTISVAYTGMHKESAFSDTIKPWTPWWTD